MVQIIQAPQRGPSLGQKFSNAIGAGLQQGQQLMQQHQQKQALEEEGISGNLPPEFQKLAYESKLKEQENARKLSGDQEIEARDYDIVQENFGKKFADVWKAAPQGGKTELIKYGLDAKSRGENLDNLLKDVGNDVPQQKEMPSIEENAPQMKNGKIPKDFEWPDFSKRPQGYTPKSWADQKVDWRKENSPIFTENVSKLDRLGKDIMATKVLHKLNESKKLPEDLERLLVNPETGDFYGLAQVFGFKSPEAQQWSKIIAQFQNRAKDAFGSRVTNFDLQSYMQQFPGLLNTKEGRRRILDMMDINWQLDNLYAKSIDEVYKHYGLNGIPYEKADELARGMVSKETEKLKEKYSRLDEENEIESGQVDRLSGRLVDVMGPDGQTYEVDESEVDQLPEGFRIQ